MAKTIVITGGTTGIGLGLARAFLDRGHNVALCNLDEDQINPVITTLCKTYGENRAIGVVCDVTKPLQIKALWEAAMTAFGGVDIWISSAGLPGGRKPVQEQDPAHILRLFRTGLGGSLLCAQIVLPRMAKSGGGWLWHMDGFGSQGAVRAGMTTYGANKAAIGYLRKALRKDAKGMGVKIGALRPGLVLTDMVKNDPELMSATANPAQNIVNIIGDRVETIAPFLVDGMLADPKDGTSLNWLTGRKLIWRFIKSPFVKRDILTGLEIP